MAGKMEKLSFHSVTVFLWSCLAGGLRLLCKFFVQWQFATSFQAFKLLNAFHNVQEAYDELGVTRMQLLNNLSHSGFS